MHKCLRLIFSLGGALVLVLGSTAAGAYTINSPAWLFDSFYLQADLGLLPGSITDLNQSRGRMENVSGENWAISDWSISILPVTESWGPGGKTTTMGHEISVNLSAHLVSVGATMGQGAYIFNGFDISADSSPPLTTPLLTVTVRWGGEQSQASASVTLRLVHEDMSFEDVIPIAAVDFYSPGNQQTFQATLPNLDDAFFVALYLFDQADWSQAGDHESDMWISATMSVTEAMQPPPDPAPLPGAWTLLGGGLATMAGLRRRKQKVGSVAVLKAKAWLSWTSGRRS
jgi:hypothetical protein